MSASTGGWTNGPTGYRYAFLSCDAAAANCNPIPGLDPAASWYTPRAGDVGRTIRVGVTAYNSAGASPPATSAQTAVVS
jgi:hypothetical protein